MPDILLHKCFSYFFPLKEAEELKRQQYFLLSASIFLLSAQPLMKVPHFPAAGELIFVQSCT